MTTYEAAQAYVARGWSVVPIMPRNKVPAVPAWREYQKRLPTEAELREWFMDKEANIAVVTGAVSGLVVVDADGDEGLATAANLNVRSSVWQLTGKGAHYLFAHPGTLVGNAVRKFTGIDVRGDGGYFLVAPSIHPNGRVYTWQGDPGSELPALPEIFLAPTPTAPLSTGWVVKAIDDLAPGNRHATLVRIIGKLISAKLDEREIVALLAPLLKQFNAEGAEKDAFVTAREITAGLMKKESEKAKLGAAALGFKTFESHAEEYARRKSGARGLEVGFMRLDKLLGGLVPEEIFTVAARTGTGKTNFLVRAAKNLCAAGKKVLYFSTEMSFTRIWDRYMVYGPVTGDQLVVCDDTISRPAQITAAIDSVKPDVFIVDHINHVGVENDILTAYMHEFKEAAKKFRIYGIVAAQLNRQAAFRDNAGKPVPPRLDMIKGSGAIEEISAQVLLLSEMEIGVDQNEIIGVLDKNRYGEKGSVSFVLKKNPYIFGEA